MEPEKRSRRGTENRQKQRRLTIRLSEDERAELEAAAERAGQTLGTYARSRMLAAPTTRATRRPTIEVATLTRLQGEMNKIGGNVHQLLKRVNFGETPAGEEMRAALAGYREVIAGILAALGRVPR